MLCGSIRTICADILENVKERLLLVRILGRVNTRTI
jgi:hypothetical protein